MPEYRHRGVACLLIVSTILSPTAIVAADLSSDPDPEKGLKLKNGYTQCNFVTRAKNRDGVTVDVPYTVDYWLPPEYSAEPTRRFPVIFVLQNMDLPRKELTELFRKGAFPPFIVVHTDGIRAPLNKGENGVWTDSIGPAGTIFRTELIRWVDNHFRTLANPKGRVLVGCSKAGGGVVHLGLHYPDLFSAVVSADGAIRLYDTGNNDGDYYTKNKMTLTDAIHRNGESSKNLPVLLLLGSMFGAEGKNDGYLKHLRSAGMRDLDYQDCRHQGHNCDAMTAESLPEVMATFYNGIGHFAAWKPTISHRAGIYAEPFETTVSLPQADWKIRYTLDGSDPHKGGTMTTGMIRIDKTCWLRAIGIAPDDQTQSRETLIRYTIQTPWPATATGKQPGLVVRAYDTTAGGSKYVQECLAKIESGSIAALAEDRGARLGEKTATIAKVDEKTKFLLYRGTITVPQSGVYDFEVADCAGLFFPQPNQRWTHVGRAFAAGIGTVQVSLEKGAHPILIFQTKKDGQSIDLKIRRSEKTPLESIPVDWFNH